MAAQVKEVKIIKPTTGEKEKLLRVGAYCRVSTDSADQLNSFFAQVQHYNDYIRENDTMRLVEIYADEGITGTSVDKRDEFKRMMRDAKNRKLDRILVKSVTRFARNALECIEAVRELKTCGVSVYFENDNIDTGCMNSEMILYIKSAFAQGEAMSASKRYRVYELGNDFVHQKCVCAGRSHECIKTDENFRSHENGGWNLCEFKCAVWIQTR